MAQITDLTWQQLETISELTNLIIVDPTYGVCIRAGALLGENPTTKTATGVVECLFELLKIAAATQTSVNVGQNIGERLAAFPPVVSGTAVNGFVQQSAYVVVKTPLANTGIVGVSN